MKIKQNFFLEVPSEIESISTKISTFFRNTYLDSPCLVVDLDLVELSYKRLKKSFLESTLYYAVKANPSDAILTQLIKLGSFFDCASLQEIQLCLKLGALPSTISFGNTIKKERDISKAFSLGVRLFAFDSEPELNKIARVAPGASVVGRLMSEGAGADWPLSKKFGCDSAMLETVMLKAHALGLDAAGISFHVGSQQTDPTKWRPMLFKALKLYERLKSRGLIMRLLNLGGGMPASFCNNFSHKENYSSIIMADVKSVFSGWDLDLIVEPGRSVVGDAGVIQAEVVLVSKKNYYEKERWVYLDIGKFSGLAETINEAIKYRIVTNVKDNENILGPVIIAGPTCDSVDILYLEHQYQLPMSLRDGDKVWIMGTGAYTATYASVGFNGFLPLNEIYL
jgi:ornithine decarboxylase